MVLNEKILKCESLFEQKEKLEEGKKGGKELAEINKLKNQLEKLMDQIEDDNKKLEKELKSQKNKKNNFNDIKTKEKIYDLINQKIQFLKSKLNGEDVSIEEIEKNNKQIQNLEEFLKKSQSCEDSGQERELYEEEKDKINEWNERKKNQNKKLEEISKGIKQLKYEGEMAREGINEIGKRTKQSGKKIDDTQQKILSQNERVKELINKLRSSDKICCDIVLILILLGLICVLYSIIKHKYIK